MAALREGRGDKRRRGRGKDPKFRNLNLQIRSGKEDPGLTRLPLIMAVQSICPDGESHPAVDNGGWFESHVTFCSASETLSLKYHIFIFL